MLEKDRSCGWLTGDDEGRGQEQQRGHQQRRLRLHGELEKAEAERGGDGRRGVKRAATGQERQPEGVCFGVRCAGCAWVFDLPRRLQNFRCFVILLYQNGCEPVGD